MPNQYLFTSLDEIFKSVLAIIWKGRDEYEESFNLIFNFIKDLEAQSESIIYNTNLWVLLSKEKDQNIT